MCGKEYHPQINTYVLPGPQSSMEVTKAVKIQSHVIHLLWFIKLWSSKHGIKNNLLKNS